jgi:hypothetical protein
MVRRCTEISSICYSGKEKNMQLFREASASQLSEANPQKSGGFAKTIN